MIHETPSACFNCDSKGGGFYKPHDGATTWHMGLDASGQAHYACAECAPLLFNVRPIQVAHTGDKQS